MRNKQTARSRETACKILDCYLALLDEKAGRPISVSQLCQRAGINRGTFYLHFDSISDVTKKLEDRFYDEIRSEIEKVTIYDLDDDFFLAIIEIILENEGLSKWLSLDHDRSDLVSRFRDLITDKFSVEFQAKHPEISEKEISFLFSFIIGGATDMLVNWLRDDEKESPEVIAKNLGFFATTLISTMFGKDEIVNRA